MYLMECLLDTTAMTFSQNAWQLHFCDAPKHDMDWQPSTPTNVKIKILQIK